jgi:hypothetical protein
MKMIAVSLAMRNPHTQLIHLCKIECTFIILGSKTGAPLDKPMTMTDIKNKTGKKVANVGRRSLTGTFIVMIGDVNIFLNDCDDDLTFGEIEIMIAEEAYRRAGYGLEGLKMMMAYGK